MKKQLFAILGSALATALFAQPDNKFEANQTYTHTELIAEYQKLDDSYAQANLIEYGSTDVGRPLHLFVMNKNKVFDPMKIQKQNVLLIMNGIHPGESCGVDASIKWSYDLLASDGLPDNVVICIIPMYNVGGSLNRRPQTRANQNGPESQGFRGNARNLDLNRDFIKADARNTRTLFSIFQDWDPDVFVDTHTTDGADFPYDLTLIGSQPDALGSAMGPYLRQIFEPALYERMKESGNEIIPYVNVFGSDPFDGWKRFFESPRYSTGFAALHHAFPFVTEAHMLKSYQDRVEATYAFFEVMLAFINENSTQITSIRSLEIQKSLEAKEWSISWVLDSSKVSRLPFKGYPSEQVPMESVVGNKIQFDRNVIEEKEVDYYEWYKPLESVPVPEYYIVPQAWSEIIERLIWNGVELVRIEKDTVIEVEALYFENVESSSQPYEGHFTHFGLLTPERVTEKVPYFAGDFLIKTGQKSKRYIIETLEPTATDSYFRWGFFDSSLQQKEWYSGYIFDTTAARMLEEDDALRRDFEVAKSADPQLAESGRYQMYWLYKRSSLYERPGRYPVTRIY